MDPLPALHPIVIDAISSSSFNCRGEGLTFRGHSRETIATLKTLLRKNAEDKKVKDWWLAQLRLYGVEAKASTRVADLKDIMKDAIAHGLKAPEKEIVELELKLNRQFLMQNAEARNREPRILESGTTSESGDEESLIVDIDVINSVRTVKSGQKPKPVEIDVARQEEEENAKRLKIEASLKACEAGDKGSFKDVEGEWSLVSSKMEREYGSSFDVSDLKMSIFFQKPAKSSVSPTLCANFKMGLLEGMLRSRRGFPLSTSCPVADIPFRWRGREAGEGEIQLDYEGDMNLGDLTFLSKTRVQGILKSTYGDFPFSGAKVGKVPVNKKDVWEDLSESQHRREEKARLGDNYFDLNSIFGTNNVVQQQKRAIGTEERDWEEEEKNAKRRKIEASSKACDVGGKGSFKDVEGEWSIDSSKIDDFNDLTMSIFFHKPAKKNHSTAKSSGSLTLCANFKMGILEGMLRSSREFPLSTSFPVADIPFTWRGRETGEGEIQVDDEGDTNLGSLTFLSRTQVKGILKSTYGDFPFSGTEVGKVPVDKKDVWEIFSQSQHRREELSRWGGCGDDSSSDECEYVEAF